MNTHKVVFFLHKKLEFTILRLDVQQDNPNFVLDGDALVKQNGHDVSHVVADAFSFRIRASGQILLNFAQLVHISLK